MQTRKILFGAALAILAATASEAQAATTTSGAQAYQATNAIAVAGGGNNGSSSEHDWGQTALVYAPPIATGNVCALGISSGVAVRDIGVALGGTYKDQDCRKLTKVSALHAMAIADHDPVLETAALALLCSGDQDVSDAVYAAGGHACPGQQNNPRYKQAVGVQIEPAPGGTPVQQPTGTTPPVALSAADVSAAWAHRNAGG